MKLDMGQAIALFVLYIFLVAPMTGGLVAIGLSWMRGRLFNIRGGGRR